MKNKRIAYLSIDSDVFIKLSVYATYGGKLIDILENNDFDTSKISEEVNTNRELSQEFYYTKNYEIPRCTQLYYIAKLYQMLKNNELKLYITPTVFGESGLIDCVDATEEKPFKSNSRTNVLKKFLETQQNIFVLTVPEDMKYSFERDVFKLAKEYTLSYAMPREYSPMNRTYVPSRDAFIVAESSLFGLFIMTFNEQHFLHQNYIKKGVRGDYKRLEIIENINQSEGLMFKDNMGEDRSPRPISVYSFVDKFYNVNGYNKKFCIYPNIDESSGNLIPSILK